MRDKHTTIRTSESLTLLSIPTWQIILRAYICSQLAYVCGPSRKREREKKRTSARFYPEGMRITRTHIYMYVYIRSSPGAVKLKKYPDRDARRITRSDLGGTFRARGETSMVIMDNTMGTHNTAVALL